MGGVGDREQVFTGAGDALPGDHDAAALAVGQLHAAWRGEALRGRGAVAGHRQLLARGAALVDDREDGALAAGTVRGMEADRSIARACLAEEVVGRRSLFDE